MNLTGRKALEKVRRSSKAEPLQEGNFVRPDCYTAIMADVNSNAEERLIEKLRKIEALFAGATTAGERSAAGSALDRIRRLPSIVFEATSA